MADGVESKIWYQRSGFVALLFGGLLQVLGIPLEEILPQVKEAFDSLTQLSMVYAGTAGLSKVGNMVKPAQK